jgi:hypothetical protein
VELAGGNSRHEQRYAVSASSDNKAQVTIRLRSREQDVVHEADLVSQSVITVADAGQADVNSSVAFTSDGTSSRSTRAKPKLGK